MRRKRGGEIPLRNTQMSRSFRRMNDDSMSAKDVYEALASLKEAVDGGFSRVEARLDRMERRQDSLEGRVGALEGRVGTLEGRVGALESRMDRVERRIILLDDRVSEMHIEMRRGFVELGRRLSLIEK